MKNLLFLAAWVTLFFACSNSENTCERIDDVELTEIDEMSQFQPVLNLEDEEYLPLNDSDYPYAGIPRIVIETKDFRQIKDRETEIPAKLQIYGKDAPESGIMELTIRGRGNTSWTEMPKKSYKIEFSEKQSFFGMPKDRDWALIANYADKTLIKNHISYKLASDLKAFYSPRNTFVELFVNREYLGVYLLTETVKVAKKRVDIQKEHAYLLEFDAIHKIKDDVVYVDSWRPLVVHSPKNATEASLKRIEEHIDSLDSYLKSGEYNEKTLSMWFDVEEYLRFYWIQEFSKNKDAAFRTSLFFVWIEGSPIVMGPVWDFDLGYGGQFDSLQFPEGWYIRDHYWNRYLFNNQYFYSECQKYWLDNRTVFWEWINTIKDLKFVLHDAAGNNFKRWKILNSTEYSRHFYAYESYEESIDSLYNWMVSRYNWIDRNL